MDEQVLAAQRWVNQTYAGVVGYEPVKETGTTGWLTMYALTRALQHELGITALSDSFGPTTLSRLSARGDIGPGETQANLVKIIQYGFYCKGYYPGPASGIYSTSTSHAVAIMMGDMGIESGQNGSMQSQVFKALLTMDAYVVVSGGTEAIREIQQWLNGRYWRRSSFFISPADGHYTRDVQQALVKALQYEIGIPDSSVNGNFGPGTQAGLRNHHLSVGDTGVFVQLFSAACVFNGLVELGPDDQFSTVFKSTYDGKLSDYVRAFETFSEIDVTGTATYGTWAQLLVSTGDPDRPVSACDTRFHIVGGRAAALANAGYRIVGRYLDEDASSTLDKELQPGELAEIFAGGLRMFPISQYNARELGDFTFTQGHNHALLAHHRAVGFGMNRGTVIYFAVDYDATEDQIESNIVPYFQGVQSGLADAGRRYIAGVYGSRNVCAKVSNQAFARYSFVSGMSYGFSGNLGFPLPSNWAFNQIKEFVFSANGDSFDLDRVAHRSGSDPGVGPENIGSETSSVSAILNYVDQLFALAVSYGGADPSLRVMESLRYPVYVDYLQWETLFGPVDQAWIDFSIAHGPSRLATFVDPSTGTELHIDHLAATACSVYQKGQASGTGANRADLGGWGGDLATFYADWMNNESSFASGYLFCADRLASPTIRSSFGFGDFIEDADGFLIGTAVRAGGSFAAELRSQIGGTGHLTRFSRFYQSRYGSRRDDCVETARTWLVSVGSDNLLDSARNQLIRSKSAYTVALPVYLPEYKLTPFLEGYADRLITLANTY